MKRSKGRAAAEHVHRCQEIASLNFLLDFQFSFRFEQPAIWKKYSAMGNAECEVEAEK